MPAFLLNPRRVVRGVGRAVRFLGAMPFLQSGSMSGGSLSSTERCYKAPREVLQSHLVRRQKVADSCGLLRT